MALNANNRKVPNFSVDRSYSLNGQLLERVFYIPDLGITVSSDLSRLA